MRKITLFSALLIVLTYTVSVFPSGVSLTGIGARATALGGNFRAVANDWSAMFWNPAGISQLQGLHVGASFELVMPGAKYTFTQNTPAFGIYRTAQFENEPRTFPIPAAGIVYGLGKMSFGLSVYAPFGLGSKWDAMDTKSYNDAYPEFEFEDDLQVIDIHPTFALKLNDKLSVGVGVGFVMSDITIRKPKTTPNPVALNPALLPLLQGFGLATPAFNHILTETELEGNGNNFSVNFGVKYNLTENLSLGLSGVYYNDISLDGKISATTYYAKANQAIMPQLSAQLDQLISAGMLTPALKAQILGVYSGQKSMVYDKAKADATLPLPMTVGGGLAFTGIEKLLISADVSWTQWSAWDVIDIAIENGSKSELVQKWEDGIRIGLGLEYALMEPLALRAGYYTEPSAIPDETLTIVIPDINRRHVVNLGASYKLGPLNLFASYEKILIGDREITKWQASDDLTDFNNMAGQYKMNVNNVMFGVGYNF